MPSGKEQEPKNGKRKRIAEALLAIDPPPQLRPKRRKLSRISRSRTPPEFWDNLSRVPLCRCALRELNRRTVKSPVPKSPVQISIKEGLLKQLKRFARHGGVSVRDIRGFEFPLKTFSNRDRNGPSQCTEPDRRTTTITSKDLAFEQALVDAGIHQFNRGPKPNNWDKIKERLAQPRASLSPSKFTITDFETFELIDRAAETEAAVMSNVLPIIKGNTAVPYGENLPFTNLAALASGISSAQPAYFNGSRRTEVHQRVRTDLGQYIMPSRQPNVPLLPNFFTEARGPHQKASGMKRQIAQDLGIGARGMLEMLSYGQDGYAYDGNAYTLGSTYHCGTGVLQIYTMHPTEPAQPTGAPHYHATQVRNFAMTGNEDNCRQGATWYRNSIELAAEQRSAAIAHANEVANARHGKLSETLADGAYESQSQETIAMQADSDTPTDEPALDADLPRKRSSKSRPSPPRKRTTGSSSSGGSAASEFWTFAEGGFHRYRGHTKVDSQSVCPRDVWVYTKDGWPNGEGVQGRLYRTDGTAEYRRL